MFEDPRPLSSIIPGPLSSLDPGPLSSLKDSDGSRIRDRNRDHYRQSFSSWDRLQGSLKKVPQFLSFSTILGFKRGCLLPSIIKSYFQKSLENRENLVHFFLISFSDTS